MTPSQSIVAAAHATRDITDATGRTLTIRAPPASIGSACSRRVGRNSGRQPPLSWHGHACVSVHAIDGVPVPQPANETQLEALVQRLGDEGIQAIANSLNPTPAEEDLATATTGN